MDLPEASTTISPGPRVWLVYAPPAPHLAAYVSGYHFMEVDSGGQPVDDIAYPSWAILRFTLGGVPWQAGSIDAMAEVPGAALFGPSANAVHFRTSGGLLVGAGVTPLGWGRLFAPDAARFANRIAPLDELLGSDAEALRQRLRRRHDEIGWTAELDAFFTARLASQPELPGDAAAIHRLLVDPDTPSVEAIAAEVGVTARHVGRIARRLFGLPPKLLLRRARFLRALLPLRQADSATLPDRVRAHYPDYSHFTRDSRAFLGMAPTAFLAMSRPISDLSTTERTRSLGAPAQALHQP